MRASQMKHSVLGLVMLTSSALFGCAEGVAPRVSTYRDTTGHEETIQRKTTDGNIARNNLSATIEGLEQRISRHPQNVDLRVMLLETLLSRTQFFGQYSDFEKALTLAEESREMFPNSKALIVAHAKVLGSVHQFQAAADLLEPFQDELEIHSLILGFKTSMGYAEIENREIKAEMARRNPNFRTMADWAHAESTIGEYEKADRLYQIALESYHDVSPFPVAWIAFQRGLMWAESANQPLRAVEHYREARRRLPGYIVATVHLAELEAEYDRHTDAIVMLKSVLGTTEDPEPAGLLGELIQDEIPEEAARLWENSQETYDRLLSQHQAAFADHASEFFAGPGNDTRRSLELALFNLNRRNTPRAYIVALEASLAAGDTAVTCSVLERASQIEGNPALSALVSEIESICR